MHVELARRHIWCRSFDWADDLLRFGLPPDAAALDHLAAVLIKMADTEDNLCPSRIPPNGAFLRERYAAAFARLTEAAATSGYTGR